MTLPVAEQAELNRWLSRVIDMMATEAGMRELQMRSAESVAREQRRARAVHRAKWRSIRRRRLP